MAGTIAPQSYQLQQTEHRYKLLQRQMLTLFWGVHKLAYTDANTGILVESDYWPESGKAGTPIIAYVNDDPMAVFRVQVSSSLAAATGITF